MEEPATPPAAASQPEPAASQPAADGRPKMEYEPEVGDAIAMFRNFDLYTNVHARNQPAPKPQQDNPESNPGTSTNERKAHEPAKFVSTIFKPPVPERPNDESSDEGKENCPTAILINLEEEDSPPSTLSPPPAPLVQNSNNEFYELLKDISFSSPEGSFPVTPAESFAEEVSRLSNIEISEVETENNNIYTSNSISELNEFNENIAPEIEDRLSYTDSDENDEPNGNIVLNLEDRLGYSDSDEEEDVYYVFNRSNSVNSSYYSSDDDLIYSEDEFLLGEPPDPLSPSIPLNSYYHVKEHPPEY
nr:PREDICTED: uncharacterized protein LOC105664203 isoform X2 [Megachile rotundata]